MNTADGWILREKMASLQLLPADDFPAYSWRFNLIQPAALSHFPAAWAK